MLGREVVRELLRGQGLVGIGQGWASGREVMGGLSRRYSLMSIGRGRGCQAERW